MFRPTILIVDNCVKNINGLNGILQDRYETRTAFSGAQAIKIATETDPPDLILLAIRMPGMDGYEVCRKLKGHFASRRIPVLFLTTRDESDDEALGFAAGVADFIGKPWSPSVVLARIETHLMLYDQSRMLENRVRERTAELYESRLQLVRRLCRAAEYKDNETGTHVMRMSHYCKLIGSAAGLSEAEADMLLNVAPMHDIGKIGIPDRILQKPGKLDESDWRIMRRHPEIGAEIIGEHSSELLSMARLVALTHHERWDGQGYPNGLKGEEIPLVGRIVAVADVFDALTSERPYKKPWSIPETMKFIKEKSGEIFDPKLVESFLGILPQILGIKEKYPETVPYVK